MRLVIVALVVIAGCGKGDPAVPAVPKVDGPSEAQIKQDLVGQTFFYTYGMGGDFNPGGKKWTVAAGEIEGLSVRDRMTDSAAGTAELEVFLLASNAAKAIQDSTPIRSIEGVLVAVYKKFDQGWKIQYVWPKAGGRPPIPGGDWGGKPFSMERVIK